jgi:hypothetical protein
MWILFKVMIVFTFIVVPVLLYRGAMKAIGTGEGFKKELGRQAEKNLRR